MKTECVWGAEAASGLKLSDGSNKAQAKMFVPLSYDFIPLKSYSDAQLH